MLYLLISAGVQLMAVVLQRSMDEAVSELSSYANDLTGDAKRKYLNKIELVNGVDPFLLPSSSHSTATPASLPPVEASDIVSYLVLQTSFLTAKQFKAYKSLEAYNQFIKGWVKNVQAWNLKDKIAVTGRVNIKMCNYGMTIIFIFYFWFHMSCLKIKSVPKGKWYCPSCRTLPEFKLNRKRSRQD